MNKDINCVLDMSFDNFTKELATDSDLQVDQHTDGMHWPDFQSYYPYIKEYYPVYLGWQNENKTEKAFKIVNILLKKNIIKLHKVKDFVELVNDIAKEV